MATTVTSDSIATSAARARAGSKDLVAGPGDQRVQEHRLLSLYARTRDQVVLEELVERFTPLARQLASRYRGGGEPMEDLVQIATVGLVNAITRFDPERGFSFSTFAVPTILGELRHHFRDRGWSVHVDRGLKGRHAAVEKAIDELTQRRGRSPSVGELSERLGLSEDEVLDALDAGNAHYALSIDATVPEGDDEDRLPIVESLGDRDPWYEVIEYGAAIAPVLEELSERDRWIVHLRFVEDRTQTEIATEIGISQMHVSRILRSTLERLRERVREPDPV